MVNGINTNRRKIFVFLFVCILILSGLIVVSGENKKSNITPTPVAEENQELPQSSLVNESNIPVKTITNSPTKKITNAATETLTTMPLRTKTATLSHSATPRATLNQTQIFFATVTPTSNTNFSVVVRTVDGVRQVLVPAGSFIAGDQFKVGYEDEKQIHQVYTDEFWIDRFLVTNSLFAKCDKDICGEPKKFESHAHGSNYYADPAYGNHPVLHVTWHQAMAFCKFRSGRLPTEAEYEKAAGWDPETSKSTLYPWGDKPLDYKMVNFFDKDRDTTPVDMFTKAVSHIGAFDMAGNVWEWTMDWYSDTYYEDNKYWINPQGPEEGQYKVVRGGGWASETLSHLRVSNRGKNNPTNANNITGFRCVYDQ